MPYSLDWSSLFTRQSLAILRASVSRPERTKCWISLNTDISPGILFPPTPLNNDNTIAKAHVKSVWWRRQDVGLDDIRGAWLSSVISVDLFLRENIEESHHLVAILLVWDAAADGKWRESPLPPLFSSLHSSPPSPSISRATTCLQSKYHQTSRQLPRPFGLHVLSPWRYVFIGLRFRKWPQRQTILTVHYSYLFSVGILGSRSQRNARCQRSMWKWYNMHVSDERW